MQPVTRLANAYIHQCVRCRHQWVSRIEQPKQCPSCRQDWTKPNKYYHSTKQSNNEKTANRLTQTQADQWARTYKETRSLKEVKDIEARDNAIKSFYATTGLAFWPIMNYGYPACKLRWMEDVRR
jgi:hypothetical protein